MPLLEQEKLIFELILINKIIPCIALGCVALACSPAYAVDYNTTADYISISFEAEEYISKDDRWVMTDASTGQLPEDEDPDPNHSDTASGGVYFEVLPDVRVTHADTFGPPTPYWGAAGGGPSMTWAVNVPEPGRYYIHARAYSTGTEDNGIHFGIDGTWPTTSNRMQFCSAGKRAWTWSSAQRDAGGLGSCGRQKTLYVDIETAGPHTISASAREDGFELDRVVMIKDLSGNTRTCTPTTATNISCRNGGIDMVDNLTDLAVSLEATPATIADGTDAIGVGSSFTVAAILKNDDNFDHATDVVLSAVFAAGLDVTSVPADCSLDAQTVTCTLADLEPSRPGENHTFEMDVAVLAAGGNLRSIDVSVENTVFEEELTNNVDSLNIDVEAEPVFTDVSVELDLDRDGGGNDLVWSVGDLGALVLTVENVSADVANTVTLNVNLGPGVDVDLLPAACSGSANIECAVSDLGAGEAVDLTFEIHANDAGTQLISASASTANDDNAANNQDTVVAQFNEVPEAPVVSDSDVEVESDTDTVDTELPVTVNPIVDNVNAGAGDETEQNNQLPDVDSDLVVASEVDTGSGTVTEVSSGTADAGSGAFSWQEFLLLLLTVSAGVYWRHQRKLVPVRQALGVDRGSRDHRFIKHDQ